MKIVLFSASVYLATGIAASAQSLIPYLDADAVAQGKQLYTENCASCHGDKLEGEPDWQSPKPDGLRPAPPHDDSGHTWHHPDAQIFDLTKRGVAAVGGRGYESAMIGYEDVLSDAEILATLAYIKSTWPRRVIEMHDAMNAAQ